LDELNIVAITIKEIETGILYPDIQISTWKKKGHVTVLSSQT
jgi:hypothetical protein